MLPLAGYDIVFQEIPGEVTLALNISGCPNRCNGCHSPHLQEDIGDSLDTALLTGLLERYGDAVTCVCFMGGDAAPEEVDMLAYYVREMTRNRLKTGWYSGRPYIPESIASLRNFDYVKLGPYVELLGGLDSPTTNQRFYKVTNGIMMDMTDSFQGKGE